jgi:tetratricopeptide (TPR) repeat protein
MKNDDKRRSEEFTCKGVKTAEPIQASTPMPAEQEQRLTVQQAIDIAVQYHQSGDVSKAVDIFQQILQADPNQPIALHFLGLIAHKIGESDRAVKLIGDAIKIKPDYADAHCNLGGVLKGLGQLNEAISSYQKALAIKPDYAEAYNNLGNALRDIGKLDDAVASYNKAIGLKPDYAQAYSNLGVSLRDLGQLDDAVASYAKALAINPDYAEAHSNLGGVFQELGQFDEAVESYNKALSINPEYAEAYSNLGNVLHVLGKLDEAVASYNKSFQLIHGGPWLNAATYTDKGNSDDWPPSEVMFTSTFKLRELIDQFDYLITKGRIDPSFHSIVEAYRAVLTEIQLRGGHEDLIKLTQEQLLHMGSSYNRAIYCPKAPRIETGTINKALDFKQIEKNYLSSSVSVTTLDDFLMPEALRALREFCLESTIYFDFSRNNFIGSTVSRGFNCDLLSQIAEEIKQCFPQVLGGHHLANIWVYRYNNQSKGVAAHADEGAVTFNLWITPDDANLYQESGGLIVYTKDQPYDWDFKFYNKLKDTAIVEAEIARFLSDADTVTIPHRENRATLFHSNLFHKSDQIHFKEGYENRRMNITFLFGRRKSK